MATRNYVYCTLANHQRYVERDASHNVVASVFIAGRANVPDKHMLTPRGVSTEVTDEELAVLRKNKVFKLHEENGYVTVDSRKADANKVSDSMNGSDPSQTDTEASLVASKKKTPAKKAD